MGIFLVLFGASTEMRGMEEEKRIGDPANGNENSVSRRIIQYDETPFYLTQISFMPTLLLEGKKRKTYQKRPHKFTPLSAVVPMPEIMPLPEKEAERLFLGDFHKELQMNIYGDLYKRGLEWEEEGRGQEAFELFLAAAEGGDRRAQEKIAFMYGPQKSEPGNRLSCFISFPYLSNKENKRRIEDLYWASMEEKCPEAIYNIAYLYHMGRKVRRDEKRAEGLYQLAGMRGFGRAYNNLGVMYAKENKEKSMAYFKQAIRLGHEESALNLKILEETVCGEEKPSFSPRKRRRKEERKEK